MNSVALSSSVREKVQKFLKDGMLPLSLGSIRELVEQRDLVEPVVLQLVKFKIENKVPGTCASAKFFDGALSYKHIYFGDMLSEQLKREAVVGKTTAPGEGGEILLISKAQFLYENQETSAPVFLIMEYDLLAKGVPLMDGNGMEHSGTPEAVVMLRDLLRGDPVNRSVIPFDPMNLESSPSGSNSIASPSTTPTTPRIPARSPQAVTPVGEVCYVNCKKIRGVATTTEFWTTSSGTKIFSCILTDEKGDGIRIVGFGNTAVKANDLVQENQVYDVIGGMAKMADPRFNKTEHGFEITLRPDTEIVQCNDVAIAPPPLKLNICPLNKICDFKDKQVDILAIIDKIEPVIDFTSSKDGKRYTKRDLYLVDKTGESVQFTLWKDQAIRFEEDVCGKAIGIKGASVKLWTGGYTLSAIAGTKWELCPNLPEVRNLYRWHMFQRHLSQPNSQASTIEGEVLIRDLPISQDSQGLDEREIKVAATITSIEPTEFQSCSNDDCQTKLIPVDNFFYCEMCDKTSDTFKLRKTFTLQLNDCSGALMVRASETVQVKMFGIDSQDREEHELNALTDLQTSSEERSKKYIFTLFPVHNSDVGDGDIRYNVLAIKEVNLERYFKELELTVGNTFI